MTRSQSTDGTVVMTWDRYPHTLRHFRMTMGWLLAYHHNSLPLALSVAWLSEQRALYISAMRHGRILFNVCL